jgi:hypothetical protein
MHPKNGCPPWGLCNTEPRPHRGHRFNAAVGLGQGNSRRTDVSPASVQDTQNLLPGMAFSLSMGIGKPQLPQRTSPSGAISSSPSGARALSLAPPHRVHRASFITIEMVPRVRLIFSRCSTASQENFPPCIQSAQSQITKSSSRLIQILCGNRGMMKRVKHTPPLMLRTIPNRQKSQARRQASCLAGRGC